MTVSQQLLEILACPNCHGGVEYLEEESVIVCRGECRYRYPVRDDIPVMLIDEAEVPADRGDNGQGAEGGAGTDLGGAEAEKP